jgi:hypothetical protein
VMFPQRLHKKQIVKTALPARQRYKSQDGVRRGMYLMPV